MIRTITIQRYRGFRQLKMEGLASVNLLVGRNNSGKTTLLEAINLLAAQGDPMTLWNAMTRRGERFGVNRDSSPRPAPPEIDVCHLFHGHQLALDMSFGIDARADEGVKQVSYRICDFPQQQTLPFTEEAEGTSGVLALEIAGGSLPQPMQLPLTMRGGLTLDTIRRLSARGAQPEERSLVNFIGTESLNPEDLGILWSEIALTPEEDTIIEALRTVEPQIERIAFVASDYRSPRLPTRGGFLLKCSAYDQPVPIGSMGDGVWRLLAMALATLRPKGGLLLVDEIDTGLHYSVMTDMWKLIRAVATRFGVQVFATTHSQDCIQSLAAICRQDAVDPGEVCIHRIEPELGRSVKFSEAEIVAAAERGVEVR
jgi:ABC-type branched-subunit amino acid transport system ATPase component